MSVVLFVGSPRVPSNTRSIVFGLQRRLEDEGVPVMVLDPGRNEETSEPFLDRSMDALRTAAVLVIATPVYLDLPPYRTLAWLHALLERHNAFGEHLPNVYAISHSGYFEPVHKDVSLLALRHFCQRIGCSWKGGLAFGGTSPIGGRPLKEAGVFTRRIRPALDGLAEAIAAGREIPQDVRVRAARSPIPLPAALIVRLMNWTLRRSSRPAD
jgi:hypothetical protein